MREPDYFFKILLLGDYNIEKTTFLTRYCNGYFTDSYTSTIGMDIQFKTIEQNNKKVKMQIYDIAGQERFLPLVEGIYGVPITISPFPFFDLCLGG